jgi:transposase
MEDVLDVYERPEDPKRPLVCMDECPKQLIGETRTPLPPEPGKPERYDSEYVRNGTCNLFMFTAPLLGWRRVEVTERRTAVDWAHQIKKLVDEDFTDADKIVLVMDNLNTHRPSSLYEAFEPMEAKRIWDRLEIHYTPKHGSWLNMAEIEFSSLKRSGLSDRVPDMESMCREATAWSERRNTEGGKIDWRFTTKDARIKLKRLYPKIQT